MDKITDEQVALIERELNPDTRSSTYSDWADPDIAMLLDRISQDKSKIQAAIDQLINAQPHLANAISGSSAAASCADIHIDMAIKILRE